MTPNKKNRLILNHEQLACLASPVKKEIIEAMLLAGESSINELAVGMDRSSKSLYYHIHQLVKAGLIREKETRLVGKRMETVYELSAERFVMQPDQGDERYERIAARSVGAMLRKAAREVNAAAEARLSGADLKGSSFVLRINARLTPETLKKLEAMVEEASRFAKENDDSEKGVRHGLTILLTPIVKAGEVIADGEARSKE